MRSLFLAAALVLLIPSTAHALDSKVIRNAASTNTFNILEGVRLDTNPLVEINLGTGFNRLGYSKLRVSIFLTRASATSITAVFSCSHDGTNFAIPTSRVCTAGACDLETRGDTFDSISADLDFEIEYDVQGCSDVRIQLGHVAAVAGDVLNFQAVAVSP